MERGRLAYLSGLPGRIAPSSNVLFKPAAAAALSDPGVRLLLLLEQGRILERLSRRRRRLDSAPIIFAP